MDTPGHLATVGRRFFDEVALTDGADFEQFEWELLRLAAEALDRGVQARRALRKHGLTYLSPQGAPVARPEIGIEKAAVSRYAQLCRQLGLGDAEPEDDDDEPAGPVRGRSYTSTNRRRRGGTYAANKAPVAP